MDALDLFTSILNKGITIVTLSDGQVYSRESVAENWTGLIVSIAIMARAHEESSTKSKRLLAAWVTKVSDARRGSKKISKTCPSWLKLSADRTEFILIPDNVSTIKRIYRMAREGMGTYIIERVLNQESVPVIGISSHWHRSYLLNILTNRAVIGEYQYFSGKGKNRKAVGDPISDYYPRIIGDDEFYSVQKILAAKRTSSAGRKGRNVPNILSGLCKCGYCGATMNYIDKGKGYDSLIFLVCSTAKRGIGCKYIPWRYSEIERVVLNLVNELQIEDISNDGGTSFAQELLATQGKLEQLTKAQMNIVEAIEAAPDVAALIPRLAELEREIVEAKKRELELSAHCSSGGSLELRLQGLKELRGQLSVLQGDDLYRLRMRVLSEIKQLLEWVRFYPDGFDPKLSEQDSMFSPQDAEFHGLGQGKKHRYLAMRFRTNGKTRFFLLNGIEEGGGIEKFAEDCPSEGEEDY